MNKSRIISAIELGSVKVTTLIGQVNVDPATFESTVSVVGAAIAPSKGIKKGQIVDIEEATESVVTAVEQAERMAGYNLDSSYIALGGAHVKSQNSHGVVAVSNPEGEINEADITRVVEAASAISLPTSREIIHVLPREYVVDGESGVKDPVGMSGVRLEVDTHIVTAGVAAIKNIKKTVGEVGINIEELVFSGIASAEATLTPTEKELGCCLVDVGGGTTSICVFLDGSVAYSSVIPIGAKNVTNDLAIGLRVSLDSAEKIKLSLSANRKSKEETDEMDLESLGISEVKKISKKTLLEGIIRPRLNEIFTMVKIELEKEGLINRIPSGVIITGGGAETAGIMDSAKRMLQLPARIGVPGGIGGLIDDIITPAFSTPIGLLLYAQKQNTQGARSGLDLGGFAKGLKLPTKGIFGKVANIVKDLLP